MKRNWIIVGAVTAMLAAATTGAGAQTTPDTTTTAPAATTPPATTPDSTTTPATTTTDTTGTTTGMTNPGGTMSNGGMSSGPMTTNSMGMPLNYALLADPLFNYTQLKASKSKGLSDNTIASILRISKLTGFSYREIEDQVLNGTTLAQIAYMDNLKLSDVLEVDTEKQQIADYEAAFETTGSMALKSMSGGSMSGGMSSSPTSSMTSTPAMPSKDIVATAMSDRRFRTLVKLLKQANLVDTLQGAGPFTVFAPTDAAFKKLPKNTIKNLTSDQLSKILTYHVLPARVDAATAMAMTSPTSPPTVEGSTLQVTTANGKVMVNGDATVTQADIMASNGIIHAIDTVLMPPDLSTGTGTGATGTDTTGTTGTGTAGATGTGGASVDTGNGTTTTTPPAAGTSGTATTGAGTGTSTNTVPAGGTTATPDAGGTTGAGTATTGAGTTGQ